MQETNNLIWIDLEMTGLNVNHSKILEIAAIITDKDLNIIAEKGPIIINQNNKILDNMNKWCIKHHTNTGLIEKVKNSKISVKIAEQQILQFIKKFVSRKSSPLCGNSVWQDRKFLKKYMPNIDNYCHYRILDVTSIKLFYQYLGNNYIFKKNNSHQALDDIRESINELKFYRDKFLNYKNTY